MYPSYRKPYKMFYIGGFIIKTIKESIHSKEFKQLMIYTRYRENLWKTFSSYNILTQI